MAKIRAHGAEIGTVHLLSHSRKYMSDGKILINRGFGWKLAGAVKPELRHLSPAELYQRQAERQAAWARRHPTAAAFSKAMRDAAPLSKRWRLMTAIEMMPDDPDGVWSTCCDDYNENIAADLDDIVNLCRLYKGALDEAKMLQEMGLAA